MEVRTHVVTMTKRIMANNFQDMILSKNSDVPHFSSPILVLFEILCYLYSLMLHNKDNVFQAVQIHYSYLVHIRLPK